MLTQQQITNASWEISRPSFFLFCSSELLSFSPESYQSTIDAQKRFSVMQGSIKSAPFLFCKKRESKFVALSNMMKNSHSGFHKFSFNSTREKWEMYEHRVWSFSKLGHVMMKHRAWTLASLIRLANVCLVCYKKKYYFLKCEDSRKNNWLDPLEQRSMPSTPVNLISIQSWHAQRTSPFTTFKSSLFESCMKLTKRSSA